MIRQAGEDDLLQLATLLQELWPSQSVADFHTELVEEIVKKDVAFFLGFKENQAIAFAQCQLRYDYVEGTESSPVGYLEGIYVREKYRKKGMAGELLTTCQTWAKKRHCSEFASDCEIENTESLKFHLAHGFIEANRIICFTKNI